MIDVVIATTGKEKTTWQKFPVLPSRGDLIAIGQKNFKVKYILWSPAYGAHYTPMICCEELK